jgi:hypothetical protein
VPSTIANPSIIDNIDSPRETTDLICLAMDFLQQMYSALEALAKDQPRLAREMSLRESSLRDHLWTLHGTVGQLTSCKCPADIMRLVERAKALIGWLASQTDELARLAAHHENPNHAAKNLNH